MTYPVVREHVEEVVETDDEVRLREQLLEPPGNR